MGPDEAVFFRGLCAQQGDPLLVRRVVAVDVLLPHRVFAEGDELGSAVGKSQLGQVHGPMEGGLRQGRQSLCRAVGAGQAADDTGHRVFGLLQLVVGHVVAGSFA